jgi:hypothetical protein
VARRLIATAAALAAVLVFGVVVRGTWAEFTAAPKTSSGNTFTVDSLGAHFEVTPGTAVQPGTSTPIASGNVDTLSLSFGTVPSARTFTSVFTVKNIGAASATATLAVSGVSQISSAAFASSGTSSATLAAGASTTVSITTSSTTAGHGSGTLRLRVSGYSWLYRDYTTTIDEAPEVPTSLTATAQVAGKIHLAWSASGTTTNLAGYNVYRSSGGAYTKINGSVVAATTYDDTATVNGTTYTYKVRAVSTGAALESVDSGTASATADSTAPAQPTAVALANGGGTSNAYINSANNSSISVSVTLPAGSLASDTVSVTLTNGAANVSGTKAASAGAGTITVTGIDASSLGDGTITISATSTDAAGNVSTARTTTVTKDTVAPSAPTASYVDNKGADQITGTAAANATITANQTLPSASGPYTTTAAANGTYTVNVANVKNVSVTYTVTATDAAGNTSAQTSVSFADVK